MSAQPGLMARYWLARLEGLAQQMPSDQVSHHAFVATWVEGRWPKPGSDLELSVIKIRAAMVLVSIYSAAATAAEARTPMLPLEDMLRLLPFRLLASELQIAQEQYARASGELALGNSSSPAGVQ